MKDFKPGEKVRTVSSLSELNDLSRFLVPLSAYSMLDKTVTILDQPIADWPLLRIREDGGQHLYPANFFKPLTPDEQKKHYHRWTEKELDEARRLICILLTCPDKDLSPDASYRFVDLITPWEKGELKEGKPRVLLIRTGMKDMDVRIYSGVAGPCDEPNVLIGMLVCLCKAKDVSIPDWIMHPMEKKELHKCS